MTDPFAQKHDEYLAAHEALTRAIRDYYAVVEPDTYIDAWTLVTHKMSPTMTADDKSAVGVLSGADQSWLMVRAMLDVAYQRECDDLRRPAE